MVVWVGTVTMATDRVVVAAMVIVAIWDVVATMVTAMVQVVVASKVTAVVRIVVAAMVTAMIQIVPASKATAAVRIVTILGLLTHPYSWNYRFPLFFFASD
jgi:hypothetical protein